MSSQIDPLNILNLSKDSLIIILIILLLLQCYGYLDKLATPVPESLVPWDTFNAKHQQSRDDNLAGPSLVERVYNAGQTKEPVKKENLVGTYNPPSFDGIGVELPPKTDADINRTENHLERSLHGV